MGIRHVVTSGFGNGTFDGTIALVAVRGYGADAATDGAAEVTSASVSMDPKVLALTARRSTQRRVYTRRGRHAIGTAFDEGRE